MRRRCYTLPLAGAALAALAATGAAGAAPAARVVSLDYCADQYVLGLLPRENVLALSPDAEKEFSYYRKQAAGLRTVRPVAEDVLALDPDLVVRSYGGGPQALQFFARAGIAVVQVPYANDFDGARSATTTVAIALGVPERGTALVAAMNARLAALGPAESGEPVEAMYITGGGATTGPGTLVHDMLAAAGFGNYESRPGWHMLPLEQLAYAQPDVLVATFIDGATETTAYWSATRHPVARRQLRDKPTITLAGTLTACGAWFAADAVLRLRAFR